MNLLNHLPAGNGQLKALTSSVAKGEKKEHRIMTENSGPNLEQMSLGIPALPQTHDLGQATSPL